MQETRRMADKTRVLIADDNPLFQSVLQSMLSNWGYEVMVAGDGVEAHSLLMAEDAPRLAILMPTCRAQPSGYLPPYPRGKSAPLHVSAAAHCAWAGRRPGGRHGCRRRRYITRPFHSQEFRARLQVGNRIVKLHERLIRVHHDLYEQATHDSLTGLWNRTAIIRILDSEIARATRGGSGVTVIMADIDHFKQVNDHYGHMAGDKVLREATHRMSSMLRKYDSMGRFGGEEFLIVIPGCQPDASLAVAERLREVVACQPFVVNDAECTATCSFGLAWSDCRGNVDATQLLREADTSLYSAKRHGRNRVESSLSASVA